MPATMCRLKPKGAKRIAYQLIDKETQGGRAIYTLLREIVHAHHSEIADARIVLAWALGWRPDVDGITKLGMCKRASDLDRELGQHDYVILLKKSFWQDPSVTDIQRQALLDHELTHAAPKCDERTGEQLLDERGRKCWRIRRHDVEEFSDVVDRNGVTNRSMELLAQALRRSAMAGFTPCQACQSNPSWVAADDAGKTLKRCACYVAWLSRRDDQSGRQAS